MILLILEEIPKNEKKRKKIIIIKLQKISKNPQISINPENPENYQNNSENPLKKIQRSPTNP